MRERRDLWAEILRLRQRLALAEAAQAGEWRSHYEAVVQATGHILYDWDARANLIRWAGDTKKILGYRVEELPATLGGWTRLVHPKDRKTFRGVVADLSAGQGPARMEYRVRRKDGQYVTLEDVGGHYPASLPILRQIGFLTDLTERKRAEEALRASEELFRRLFEESPVGMVLRGIDSPLYKVNPAFCHMLGYTRGEFEGTRALDVTFFADRTQTERLINAVIRGDVPEVRLEKRYVTRNGKVVWADLKASLIRDSSGKPLYVLGTVEDITARKQTEHALRERQQLTEKALDRTKEELRALTGSLFTAQEEERRRLARELHDDLSQKLAMLEVHAEMLERKPPGTAEELQQELATLRRSAATLSEDLRRISHELHPSILDHLGLPVALRSLAEEFHRRESLEVHVSVRDMPAAIPMAVASSLYRITQEALRNVAKHAGKARVRIALRGAQSSLRLTIRDWGPGFNPARSLRRNGLGIISMEERARLVGGMLRVVSERGKGTTIEVKAPLGGAG